ncbi:uncharacterized protein [Dermacentor andersoni]|uniref:uncharacterized protein n=1 Tax=Dermacentor andersoni TaxID=34620 RepID=UPI002155759A|nr:uncharacterized protein LOC126524143 [Dermacentor andersoni]
MVADALLSVAATSPSQITADVLAEAQTTDAELQQLLKGGSSLQLQQVPIPESTTTIYCDISTAPTRPYVPLSHRRGLFNQLHNSRPGIRASTRLVADRYVWPSMQRDCRTWARSCIQCQRAKVTRHVNSPLCAFPQTSGRFQLDHLDIIGPLPPAGRYRYCLTAIYRNTRWPVAWPIEGITAEDVASAFLASWIARFGPPRRVTTDQGQFESHLFRLLGLTIGLERSWTTSYHPCANGMLERFHRHFKAAIVCHPYSTWPEAIPAVTLGPRATFKPDIQATLAELVYREPLRLPGEFLAAPPSSTAMSDPTDFIAWLRRTIAALRPSYAAHHCKTAPFVFKDLATCSHTCLRDDSVLRPLQPPYSKPYPVLRRDGKTFTLHINGDAVRVPIGRLKPAYTDSAQPGNTSAPTDVHPRPPTSQPASVTTCTGRRVRCPDFYKP